MLRSMLVLSLAAFGSAGIAVHAASATQPATYTVQVDGQPPVGEPWDFLRFFPGGIRVHQGDVIDAAWAGSDAPHTATVVPSSDPESWRAANQGPGGPYEFTVPDSQLGGDDQEADINPSVLNPSSFTCGIQSSPCDFSGSGVVTSGFQSSNPAAQPSFFVKIDAPVGTYSFLCLVHPGMEILLHVARPSTSIPTPRQVDNTSAKQFANATAVDAETADAQAQQVAIQPIAGGHTRYTIHAGGFFHQVTANEYPDQPLTMSVGDKLMVKGNLEIHTATFPGDSYATVPFIVTECEVPGPDTPASSPADCASPADFRVALNSQAVIPTGPRLTDTTAFVNSGLLTKPGSFTFVAKAPGTYTFVCLVHGPSMSETLTVQA
jgi:plastocyanin